MYWPKENRLCCTSIRCHPQIRPEVRPYLCFLVIAFVGSTGLNSRAGEFDIPYHPTRVIVRFRPGVTPSARQQAVAAVSGAQAIRESRLTAGLELIEVANGQVPAAVLAYRQDPDVMWARPSYEATALDFPDDPEFSKLWGLHNTGQTIDDDTGVPDADVDAPQAWDIWEGTGDCVVAVVDTGVDYRHPDLYLSIWINQGEIPPAIYWELTDVDSDGWITFVDLNDPANEEYVTDVNANGFIDGGDILDSWADHVDNDGNGKEDDLVGWDAFSDDNDPNPTGVAQGGQYPSDPAHGTRVAGVIAAIGNNTEGVVGLARGCKIVPIKAGDENGHLFDDGILWGTEYLVANVFQQNIRVSVHSYGSPWGDANQSSCSPFFPQELYDNFVDLHATGHHIAVAAAGNSIPFSCWDENNNDVRPVFPASFGVTGEYTRQITEPLQLHVDGLSSVLSVAATNSRDLRWGDYMYDTGQSHYGPNTVHLAAPGVGIYSSSFYEGFNGRVYEYIPKNGTSLAAPHVAATAALLWNRYPDWTREEVRDRILSTGRPLQSLHDRTILVPLPDDPTGMGRIVNAYRALNYDCNANGVDDVTDIVSGISGDCTGYETDCCVPYAHEGNGCDEPDIMQCVCQTYGYPDCCSGAWNDDCASLASFCFDGTACFAHSDWVPDECQPGTDCQGNGIPDACDLTCGGSTGPCAAYPGCGQSADCNGNCVPDECDIAPEDGGLCNEATCSNDCQANGVPDECDIDTGDSCDWDEDGTPDECYACCVASQNVRDRSVGNCPGDIFNEACLSSHDCTCGGRSCCLPDGQCSSTLTDCECLDLGGHPSLDMGCFEVQCSLGACCNNDGSCTSDGQNGITPTACPAELGRYVGGVRCTDTPCTPLFPLPPKPAPEAAPAFAKNRFLSLTPPTQSCGMTAIRVTLIDMYKPARLCLQSTVPCDEGFPCSAGTQCIGGSCWLPCLQPSDCRPYTGPDPDKTSWCEDVESVSCLDGATCDTYDPHGCPARPPSDPDLFRFEGQQRWVGRPEVFPHDTVVGVGAFVAAPLQCCPYFRDWSAEALADDLDDRVCNLAPSTACTVDENCLTSGSDECVDVDFATLHVYGAEVVPCSTYEMQVAGECCPDLEDERCYSEGLIVSTALFGDIYDPANYLVNFIDVGQTVNAFKGIGPPAGPGKLRALLRGNVPALDSRVSFIDISVEVNAYKTIGYEETGPASCGACP